MSQDLNPSTVHLWPFSCIRHAKDKEVYFLCCNQKARTASAQSLTLWQQAMIEITWRDHFCYYLFTSHIFVCCSLRTSHLWWIALSTQHQLRGCNNAPSFLQWTAPIAHSFCGCCTWHHFHILVKAPLCCDWKAQAASMQSFTLWQQATIEIPHRTHSVSIHLRHIYIYGRDDHDPVCWLDIQQDSEFATGSGYPKTAFKWEPDTDPDIRTAFIDISRIQTFGKSCTLHNHAFIIFRSIFSAFCALTPSLSMG